MPIILQQTGSLFCTISLVLIGAGVFFVVYQTDKANAARAKQRQAAFDAYRSELAKLKQNPTDPNIKERALQLGRTYANHTRQQKGVTVFDEVALANDISAATAGATATQVVPTSAAPPAPSLADRMKQLNELRDAGLISDAEYAARRQKIIEET